MPLPDVVRISRLETEFDPETHCTSHLRYVSESKGSRKKILQRETWKHERSLGRGGSGLVSVETCVHGDRNGEVRAVRRIQKLQSGNFHRELEAITLFSNEKLSDEEYNHCFVESFGWFETSDCIFISMEYIQNGDLQRYMGKPLLEDEGQQIIAQVLQGLSLMHAQNFAHRDLKPANLLVVNSGPEWWVKIADFGISKRAAEGLTDLRTMTGTPGFVAPEVMGFIKSSDNHTKSYTNAVDIWSLGAIAFLILTGETLFADSRRLGDHCRHDFSFPENTLLSKNLSIHGCNLVRQCMAVPAQDRPTTVECLKHPWISPLVPATEASRQQGLLKHPVDFDAGILPPPSACWSARSDFTAGNDDLPTNRIAEKSLINPSNTGPTGDSAALKAPDPRHIVKMELHQENLGLHEHGVQKLHEKTGRLPTPVPEKPKSLSLTTSKNASASEGLSADPGPDLLGSPRISQDALFEGVLNSGGPVARESQPHGLSLLMKSLMAKDSKLKTSARHSSNPTSAQEKSMSAEEGSQTIVARERKKR